MSLVRKKKKDKIEHSHELQPLQRETSFIDNQSDTLSAQVSAAGRTRSGGASLRRHISWSDGLPSTNQHLPIARETATILNPTTVQYHRMFNTNENEDEVVLANEPLISSANLQLPTQRREPIL